MAPPVPTSILPLNAGSPFSIIDAIPEAFGYWFYPLGPTDSTHFVALWFGSGGTDVTVGLLEITTSGIAVTDTTTFSGWSEGWNSNISPSYVAKSSDNSAYIFGYLTNSEAEVGVLIVSATSNSVDAKLHVVPNAVLDAMEPSNYRFSLCSDGSRWAFQGYNGVALIAYVFDSQTGAQDWYANWVPENPTGNYAVRAFPDPNCLIVGEYASAYLEYPATHSITALWSGGQSEPFALGSIFYNNDLSAGSTWNNTDIRRFTFVGSNASETGCNIQTFSVQPSGADWIITASSQTELDFGAPIGTETPPLHCYNGLVLVTPYSVTQWKVFDTYTLQSVDVPNMPISDTNGDIERAFYDVVAFHSYTSISATRSGDGTIWFWGTLAPPEPPPLRMSSRNDGRGLTERHPRMNNVLENTASSAFFSNRIYGEGDSSYDPHINW